jgi:hypothetical protein
MFGGGMPILYVIGLISTLFFYWVDKFLFLKHFRTPPRFNIRLGQKASSMIYFALILHTTFTIWMFGNDEIFISDEYRSGDALSQEGIEFLRGYDQFGIRSKLLQRHTFLLFATLICLTLYGIIHHLYGDFTGCTSACFNFFLCGDLKNVRKQFENEEEGHGDSVSFYDAIRNKQLKGLHSYNLLKNPVYMRAIRISESFADRHSHMHSAVRPHCIVLLIST